MPYLMINLDDLSDCQRGHRQLGGRLHRAGVDPLPEGREGRGGPCGPGKRGKQNRGGDQQDAVKEGPAGLPLKQKLNRISKRGVWRFVAGIAKLDETPRSLAELDEALSLQPNKMRSTKAIFAKLENRFDIRFLKLAEDAGDDAAGNPRYIMPPRIRKFVREMVV
ncbi:hypothetical protein Poly51_22160 [Rubripirellula tenax]|uniref:Uncharacterized protein n=1 Tax=Rubripirellula tenax TaxID=2528015 RepID=A0A5C6FD80_9BACT|nr:hypothetical protein [Rubripirellula tenax]TWU59428.1 hypothetical protein Poly51_22160 [Rubripirellula tenax]